MLVPPITIPNVFVNGTIADANQVDANFATLLNAINQNQRIILSSDLTFFVAPSGSDTLGNGFSPTTPAATFAYVRNLVQTNYDLNGHNIVVQAANGTYNQTTMMFGTLLGQQVPSQFIIQGNLGAPGLVTVTGDPPFFLAHTCLAQIQGMTLTSSISDCIIAQNNSTAWVQTCVLGPAVNALLTGARDGRIITIGNLTMTGGAIYAARGIECGEVYLCEQPPDYLAAPFGVPTITFVGTPAFTGGFVAASNLGFAFVQAAFVGSATGPNYFVHGNGSINLAGQNPATYLPGNAAGVNDGTGGQVH